MSNCQTKTSKFMSNGIFPIDGVSFPLVLVALMCPRVDIFLIRLTLVSYLMLWKQEEASRLTPEPTFIIDRVTNGMQVHSVKSVEAKMLPLTGKKSCVYRAVHFPTSKEARLACVPTARYVAWGTVQMCSPMTQIIVRWSDLFHWYVPIGLI